jgi:glycosyltransferase involved in cell wall biosynthesis
MNSNLTTKVYLNNLKEDWIIDRLRKEWYQSNNEISTNNLLSSNIVWLIAPWSTNVIVNQAIKVKKTLCSIYHIDEEKFDKKSKNEFFKRDQYVDHYHVISKNTEKQLTSLTSKKISSLPFWINEKIFFEITDREKLKNELGIPVNKYIIGSFQRDSEGSDTTKPKLSKGPDQFLEIIKNFQSDKKDVHILLSGRKRDYIINNLTELKIPYTYFEMVDLNKLNKLYNCLDLYIVASRVEGGPQAILECGITKTPIISTNVGIASEILHKESIFDMTNFLSAKPNVDFAFANTSKFTMQNSFLKYTNLLKEIVES